MTNTKKRTYKHYRYPGVRHKGNEKYLIDFIDHNGKRRQKTISARSEADAAQIRRNVLTERDKIKAGLIAPPEDKVEIPTLAELWRLFQKERQLKVKAGSLDQKTHDRYENSFTNLLNCVPSLDHKRLNDIKSAVFEGFKVHRREMGYKPAGINIDLRNFRTLLNYAVANGYLDKSPLKDVSLVKVPDTDVRFLNDDELSALKVVLDELDLSDDLLKDARDLILFYLYTGARTSEVLYPTFTWECDQQNFIRFPLTKWGKSRSIPKLDAVKMVLESRKHIAGGPFHLNRHTVYKRVKTVLRMARITDATTHTLRATAGAWYYMSTRDIFATSRFLGHSKVEVTAKHYAGLIQSLQVEYARMFGDALDRQLQLGCNSELKAAQNRQTKTKEKGVNNSPLVVENTLLTEERDRRDSNSRPPA